MGPFRGPVYREAFSLQSSASKKYREFWICELPSPPLLPKRKVWLLFSLSKDITGGKVTVFPRLGMGGELHFSLPTLPHSRERGVHERASFLELRRASEEETLRES
jgi:hypothetical protein